MRDELLSDDAVAEGLAGLSGWERDGACIRRTFVFADFVEAFGFMTRAALEAERRDHHPDWRNVYARVEVELTTHDAGGLTVRDLELAAVLDRLAAGSAAP
jgi:4a-hydroxytetrahydrobiopterin dehydratase